MPKADTYGVHSEVGQLRKVLVCEPRLAHQRLTPSNRADFLFDDVMWVESGQQHHRKFVESMQSHGVAVVELHDLLAQTVVIPTAKAWLLDRLVVPTNVCIGLLDSDQATLVDQLSKP